MTAFFGPGGNSDSFRLEGYKSTVQAPAWVSSKGLNAYEFEAGRGLSASFESLKLIANEAKKHSVKLSYHAPYFISLSSIEEVKRLKSIEYIRESLDAAHALGAETIVVHTGSASKITRNEAMQLAADTLIKTLSSVDTYGIKIGLETMGKINQLGTLDEVLELCRIDKTFVPVIDFGHLNARECGGVFNSADDYMRVFDKIDRLLGSNVANNLHCHFSKIEYKAGGEYKHLTFIDNIYGPEFEPLVDVIASNKLTPTIICESAGTQAEDALAMKKYYESKL